MSAESGGTPKTGEDSYWDGGIPWLTPKEITGDYTPLYVSHTERTISRIGLTNSAAKLLPAGTVLLTKRAPVGTVAVAAVPITTNQGFLNFVCGPRLNPLYLAFWLRANKIYLDAVANGSTYPELYKGDLFEFEMGVPPPDEQKAIVSYFLAIQKLLFSCNMAEQSSTNVEEVTRIQSKVRRIIELREQLAPFLLTGRLSSENSRLDLAKAVL
ncbi:restriction endonuclease subunit S [Bradyrhizobium sp. USDA 4354]